MTQKRKQTQNKAKQKARGYVNSSPWSKGRSGGVSTNNMKHIYNNKIIKRYRRKLRKEQTDAERLLWSKIRKRQINGYRFVRQYSVGNFILDFYCQKKRLGIELDGGKHNEKERKSYDKERTKHLKRLDIKMLRFWNNQVLKNTDSVLEKIFMELGKR